MFFWTTHEALYSQAAAPDLILFGSRRRWSAVPEPGQQRGMRGKSKNRQDHEVGTGLEGTHSSAGL